METQAKRPGLMPPSGPIQAQHAALWDEVCAMRMTLRLIRMTLESEEAPERLVERLREIVQDRTQGGLIGE